MDEKTLAAQVPQPLCSSADLPDGGSAFVFDVEEFKRPARAFVLRFEGQVVGYLNRCAHVPVELDWRPGEFLDRDKRQIICAVHGATYNPLTGKCTSGPAGRGRLRPLQIAEADGQVYWYPCPEIQPPSFD
jgi:nitrite reductase/ring-hydroxylating ferredoxin subunit